MKMKALLFFVFFTGVMLSSCNKERGDLVKQENLQNFDEIPTFKYCKELMVLDEEGNQASLRVFANTLHAIENHGANDFELVVTHQNFSDMAYGQYQENVENVNDENELLYDEDRLVYIEVVDHKLKAGVTGFRVDVVGADSVINLRGGWNYHYAYGSQGARGVFARYDIESCSKEYVKLRLHYRDNGGIFWHTLGKAQLTVQGAMWYFYSSTEYYLYRFGYKWKKDCSDNHFLFWFWLL